MTTTVPKIFAFHEFSGVAEAVADHVVHAQDSALAPKTERKHSVTNLSVNALDMTREVSCKSTASAPEVKNGGSSGNSKAKKEKRFKIALSGGSLIQVLHEGLLKRDDVQWGEWDIYFADERLVPFSSNESNYGCTKRKILDQIDTAKYGTPKVYHIDESLIDDPQECADNYEKVAHPRIRR